MSNFRKRVLYVTALISLATNAQAQEKADAFVEANYGVTAVVEESELEFSVKYAEVDGSALILEVDKRDGDASLCLTIDEVPYSHEDDALRFVANEVLRIANPTKRNITQLGKSGISFEYVGTSARYNIVPIWAPYRSGSMKRTATCLQFAEGAEVIGNEILSARGRKRNPKHFYGYTDYRPNE